MELDHIEPAPLAVERPEPRRVFVGEPRALESFSAAANGAERRQALGGMAAALPAHRLDERLVGGEEVDVLERRALVEDLVGRKRVVHGAVSRSPPDSLLTLATPKPPRTPDVPQAKP